MICSTQFGNLLIILHRGPVYNCMSSATFVVMYYFFYRGNTAVQINNTIDINCEKQWELQTRVETKDYPCSISTNKTSLSPPLFTEVLYEAGKWASVYMCERGIDDYGFFRLYFWNTLLKQKQQCILWLFHINKDTYIILIIYMY